MKVTLDLTEREIEFLKQYASVYRSERDLDATADPIVMVDTMRSRVGEEGYDDCRTVYVNCDGEEFSSLEEVREETLANGEYEEDVEWEEFVGILEDEGEQDGWRILSVMDYYEPVAYFLTRVEAEKYVKYQSHNLNNPRVYTRYMGYSNCGDLQALSKMLLRIGGELDNEEIVSPFL